MPGFQKQPTPRRRSSAPRKRSVPAVVLLLVLLLAACNIDAPAATDTITSATQPNPTATPSPTNSPAPTPYPIPTGLLKPTATRALKPSITATLFAEPTATTEPEPSPLPTATPSPRAATPPETAPTSTTPPPIPSLGSEILFLRAGTLMAYDVGTDRERQIAVDVSEFAATPDGHWLALVRGTGRSGEVWVMRRDGRAMRQLTENNRAEGSLAWTPDGALLAYASTTSNQQRPLDWPGWAAWCETSEIHMITIDDGSETVFEPGCDPSFSPDGRRIAFATPPETTEADGQGAQTTPNTTNAIRLINSKGENGWNFSTAGDDAESGRLVYAPAWSPDGAHLAYNRFVGYQALVDINYIEMANSFEGNGDLVGIGAGWLLPPRFAPGSTGMVVGVEYDPANARGWSGYEMWQAQVLTLAEEGTIFLPEGEKQTIASEVDRLARATGAAWSPEGNALVVNLPPGWQPDTPDNQPTFEHERAGALWRWEPGNPPDRLLTENVDFASPLLWLPPL